MNDDRLQSKFLLIVGLLLAVGIVSLLAMKWVLGVPLNRWQRGQLLLDVIEIAIGMPGGLNLAIARLNDFSDPAFGRRVQARLRRLAEGEDLIGVLTVPLPILPRRMVGLLEAGLKVGKLSEAIGWCRDACRQEQRSRTRGTANYAPLAADITSLGSIGPGFFLFVVIATGLLLSRYHLMLAEYLWGYPVTLSPIPLPTLSGWVLAHPWFMALAGAVLAAIPLLLLVRHFGEDTPWLTDAGGDRLLDWLDGFTPWRRWRLERDFCFVLAMLLDEKMAEEPALRLAAAATGSSRMQRRTDEVIAALQRGQPLAEAVDLASPGRELAWRWQSAIGGGGSLLPALRGWLDYLEARAFQAEQTAAHLLSTGLYLGWGVLIGTLAIAILHPLIRLTDYLVTTW